MKKILFVLALIAGPKLWAQHKIENLIIVTTDGFRWQEVFRGMDSAIANDKRFNQNDSAHLYDLFWDIDASARRKKLMPFLWSVLQERGQLYGNRDFDNKVDNANPYWFSYPGYNEMMTGYPDTAVNSNSYKANPNSNVLAFLNKQPGFAGKVAAFGAWDAFDRILNAPVSGFPVVAAFAHYGGDHPSENQQLINQMREDSYKPFGEEECLDVFTHYEALDYLKTQKPRVLYISYGETDEWAHAGRYRDYLMAARQVDAWLAQLWAFVQSDPQYKDKTALLITVDHGRGDLVKSEWVTHNQKISDAHQIWFGIVGPGLANKGEIKTSGQLYQRQLAQTMARLLGFTFKADHPIGDPVEEVFQK